MSNELSLGTNWINNNDCLRFGQLLWPSSGCPTPEPSQCGARELKAAPTVHARQSPSNEHPQLVTTCSKKVLRAASSLCCYCPRCWSVLLYFVVSRLFCAWCHEV